MKISVSKDGETEIFHDKIKLNPYLSTNSNLTEGEKKRKKKTFKESRLNTSTKTQEIVNLTSPKLKRNDGTK